MTHPQNASGAAPKAILSSRQPVEAGLGWREFFERLGNGTLPRNAGRGRRSPTSPIRSFNGPAMATVSR